MPKVIVADHAGFCFGVRRAVSQVYDLAAGEKPVYTYGEIIHNETVVDDLRRLGVRVIEDLGELSGLPEGTVVLRSHGVTADVTASLEKSGQPYVDATCPFVAKIHRLVQEFAEDPENLVVLTGAAEHPEVQGILSRAGRDTVVIADAEEAEKFAASGLADGRKVKLLSQTTFSRNKFQDIVEILGKKLYDISVVDTICNATGERQKEAEDLSRTADAMIVIGGKKSSNTQKLYEICKQNCLNTYYIQTPDDLDPASFGSFHVVGITAGASTPEKIIEEVQTRMAEEMTFDQMLEESLKTIHNGDVVEGTVIGVKEDEIILDIGYKAEGIITKNEYSNTPVNLTTVVHEGDKMEAKVLKLNDGEGQVVLTYKRLAAERGNKKLEEAFNNKEVLKATVSQVLNGGLSVVIDEARVFIPASLVSDTYERNLEKYAGQEIEFVITEFNPKRRRIIGDRKQLLVARKAELKKALFDKLAVGQTVVGTVKNVTDFGAFIDLGGADGLLHISEMSWGHIENPKKIFKVGDEVKAFVKDIQGEKIALSLKFEDQNPWIDAEKKFAIGNIVTGKVARMTDFGAFIELEPGVDALLHVSQIAKEHVEKPSDVLKPGEQVTAKVVDFNAETRKISLSIKALLSDDDQKDSEEAAEEIAEEAANTVDAAEETAATAE